MVTSDRTEHRFHTQQMLFDPFVMNVYRGVKNSLDQNVPYKNDSDFDYGSSIDYSFEERRLQFELRRDKEFQTVLGFGGSFTDAAGRNIASLKPVAQVIKYMRSRTEELMNNCQYIKPYITNNLGNYEYDLGRHVFVFAGTTP